MRRNMDRDLRALERAVRGGAHDHGTLTSCVAALTRSGLRLNDALTQLALFVANLETWNDEDDDAHDLDSVVETVDRVAVDIERQTVGTVSVTNDGLAVDQDRRYMLIQWPGSLDSFDATEVVNGALFWDPVEQAAVVVRPTSPQTVAVISGRIDIGFLRESSYASNRFAVAAQELLSGANDVGRKEVSRWVVATAIGGLEDTFELYSLEALFSDETHVVERAYLPIMTALTELGVTPGWSIYAPGPPDPDAGVRRALREEREEGW